MDDEEATNELYEAFFVRKEEALLRVQERIGRMLKDSNDVQEILETNKEVAKFIYDKQRKERK